ncbi:TetR/AcrR family transcriptional regulator [Flavobacteriaceae bacterium]|jgi:AcrR family transcriptional regulator|nr:TetR/AcrR family transcriptional regulator [Flavobacteriaceae bacterium]CAI8332839.1 MAG: HTH-type transcriptional repressor KstR2 [Formosa sp. Hel3_A1_48]
MKEKIIYKSEELFLTLGFKNVTMDDIASALGISKKTIYTHFSNKTELVSAVTFSVLEQIYLGIEQINKKAINPIEELYDIKMFLINYLKNERVSAQYQLKKYYPKIFDQLQIKKFKKMHSSVENSLKKGVELNLFRSEIDTAFISRVYFVGMTGIRDTSVFSETMFDKNYLMESYLEYHLRAIVTESGLQLLDNYIKKNKA